MLHPFLALPLLATSQTILTTLTLANVSKTVVVDLLGTAFGLIEIMDAMASLLGNALFGMVYVWTGNYDFGMMMILWISYGSCVLLLYLAYTTTTTTASATNRE